MSDVSIWPPSLEHAPVGPRTILEQQAAKLKSMGKATASVTAPRRGEHPAALAGLPTDRVDLKIKAAGQEFVAATIEYPAQGYPVLIITGAAPHWRYQVAYSPGEFVEKLRDELGRDARLSGI